MVYMSVDHLIDMDDQHIKRTSNMQSVDSPIQVDFIPQKTLQLPGRLGMTFAPGKKGQGLYQYWNRDLNEDLGRIREIYRGRKLISLIEDHELVSLDIEDLVKVAKSMGIDVVRFPIVDASVPAMKPTFELVADILKGLRSGFNTVIHCRGGLGRAGTITACTLVASGLEAVSAIRSVRHARQGTIETTEQEEFVLNFASSWVKFTKENVY